MSVLVWVRRVFRLLIRISVQVSVVCVIFSFFLLWCTVGVGSLGVSGLFFVLFVILYAKFLARIEALVNSLIMV